MCLGDLDGDIFNIITIANEALLMVDGDAPGEYEGSSKLLPFPPRSYHIPLKLSNGKFSIAPLQKMTLQPVLSSTSIT